MKPNKNQNKSEENNTDNKAVSPNVSSIDFASLPESVTIIAIGKQKHMEEGKEYNCSKVTAEQLIKRSLAKLKGNA